MNIMKGVTFGFYARNGYYSSANAKVEVDRIAELGIPWVCLIATIMQENYYSTRMFRDSIITPGDDELIEIIGYLHKKGIQVMLRPMIECWDGTQRLQLVLPQGEIFSDRPFHYRKDWFDNYAALTRHYLRIAVNTGCEAYGLDSELNGLVDLSEEWLGIIEYAKKQYIGQLTTSLVSVPQYTQKLDNPNFWFYALDSIGSSMYQPGSKNGGDTIECMVEYLQDTVKKYETFAIKYGKPFYFGECGCCATEKATKLPYYWKNGEKYDGQEQANYMAAVIGAFHKKDWWKGMFWWKWDEQNSREEFHNDPAGEKGFTIYGKPAAEVMRHWCAQGIYFHSHAH